MKEITKLLIKILKKIDIPSSDKKINSALIYLNEIIQYNNHTNILGTNDPREIIIKHFIDSLTVYKYINKYSNKKIADLGSGAGLPGLILGIFDQKNSYFLIESKKKKIEFLNHTNKILDYSNIHIINKNVFEINNKFDIILSRAFGSLEKIIKSCKNITHSNSIYFLHKGKESKIKKELKSLKNYKVQIDKLTIPYFSEERHIISINN